MVFAIPTHPGSTLSYHVHLLRVLAGREERREKWWLPAGGDGAGAGAGGGDAGGVALPLLWGWQAARDGHAAGSYRKRPF